MRSKSMRASNVVAMAIAAAVLLAACGGGFRPYPLKAPLWKDPDTRPHETPPEEYYSPWAWDAADQTVFRPFARIWAVDPAGEAVNVNAIDEVPDSSWFQNRIGRFGMSPAEAARGPCVTPPLDPAGPWTVKGGKPNGANPGFITKGNDGRLYMLKFDGTLQGPRATAADVIVSKIYYAAGFYTPCNRIVYFDRSILKIDPDAESENEEGEKVKMTEADLDTIFSKAIRLPDGRYRASASLFLDGKPLGPFTYQGKRCDDPNDVVAHEDRRELRGSKLLAAWTNHFDSREQNSLTMWIEHSKHGGHVRHNIIDFGDCFGSIWEPPMLGRRIGHSSYLDPSHIGEDFINFGMKERPWDVARFGPSGKVWGYFDVERFDPEEWQPGFPNPAMTRMVERDGAWMARIMAHFTDAHLRAMIATGKIGDPLLERELTRILIGRRDKILARYLSGVSSLSKPRVHLVEGTARLCLNDLGVQAGVFDPALRAYRARAWLSTDLVPAPPPHVERIGDRTVCTVLPPASGASPSAPRYVIVDVTGRSGSQNVAPARVHLYHLGGSDFRVVGLERPDDDEPPG
ncbi:MAG: hypothetical protein JRI23_00265 [Deltaproteobacteria bacterium]|jgi:hypothetical protein|nr:hypothetical protein [Deltaproteobacteria bacterium]MBW2529875.1 hypothetical protein [Deltaproteobacteria bacterium]